MDRGASLKKREGRSIPDRGGGTGAEFLWGPSVLGLRQDEWGGREGPGSAIVTGLPSR